jgi:hypothetical protein
MKGDLIEASPQPNAFDVKYSSTIVKSGDSALEIEYSFGNMSEDRWLTVAKVFDEPQNFTIGKQSVMSFWLYGDNSGNLLSIDLIDVNENAGRYHLPLDFSGWKQIHLLMSQDFFLPLPGNEQLVDFTKLTKKISISIDAIEKPVSDGRIFLDEFYLLEYTQETEK